MQYTKNKTQKTKFGAELKKKKRYAKTTKQNVYTREISR